MGFVVEGDPHIHVERDVLTAGAAARNVTVALVGRAPDAPSVVTTGCGIQVAYAMTSTQPESVTCLACREHAHRTYMRFAEQVERMLPGNTVNVSAADVARIRELARRYST
ncbi:hypothetical protein GCM10029964_005380 [Kibdelosporangium lantanae]